MARRGGKPRAKRANPVSEHLDRIARARPQVPRFTPPQIDRLPKQNRRGRSRGGG
jgi:hypothetical protein